MKKLLALSIPAWLCCASVSHAADQACEDEIAPMTRSGCWAILYDDTGFEGRSITVAGSTRIQEMDDFLDSLGWAEDSLTSVKLGPNASMLVYADDHFTGKAYRLKPSKSFVNLKRSVPARIESLRLSCVD